MKSFWKLCIVEVLSAQIWFLTNNWLANFEFMISVGIVKNALFAC